MDDFNISSLNESRNEWSSRLLGILTPLIIDGYKSILDESIKLCNENNEIEKYLMTFQNLISRVPKWNSSIIEKERKRICEKSGCNYLDDLITCVHILQLKILTAMRVGQKQKKIDINIPKVDDFIHKCYINAARKIYKNVYLFEINIPPLQVQKNYRELEIIIQESILITLRESIPVEAILKAYMDETVEEDVVEEVKEQILEEPVEQSQIKLKPPPQYDQNPYTNSNSSPPKENKLQFNDIDYVSSGNGDVTSVVAPKTIDRLEKISEMRSQERKLENDDDDNEKITISDQSVTLDALDVHNIEEPRIDLLPDLLIDEIEILD
jgi:hypothetical protein